MKKASIDLQFKCLQSKLVNSIKLNRVEYKTKTPTCIAVPCVFIISCSCMNTPDN
jgi:hypothetical protein